jgi:CarD family transcriptional regulator
MAAPSRPSPDRQKHPESTVVRKAEKKLLQPGARCVHPQHGVVEVTGIVDREIGGTMTPFYELRLVASNGKILVPVAAAERAGLRPIMSEHEADEILAFFRTRRPGVDSRPFQKRMRIYSDMIRSGDRRAIAEVLRDMHRTAASKDLSFGERKLLTQARTMLVTELALAKHVSIDAIESELEAVFAA